MVEIEETPIELLDDYYSPKNCSKKGKKIKDMDWKMLSILILLLFIIVLVFYIVRSKN